MMWKQILRQKNADLKTRVKALQDLVIDEKRFGNCQRDNLTYK